MRLTPALFLLPLLLLLPASAPAQTSAIPLSHWQHSSWTGEQGPPLPVARSMLRSPDGYLWLGSYRGLIRFDGVRFTLIDTTYSRLFPVRPIEEYNPVLIDRTGKMWITGPRMLLSYSDGEFRSELDSGLVHGVAEDGSGKIWVAESTRLYLLRNGRLEAPPLPPGVPDTAIVDLLSDNDGGFWIGTIYDGIWYVSGTSAAHYGSGKMSPLLRTADGTLWANQESGPNRGLVRLKGGTLSRVYRPDRPDAVTGGILAEGPDGSVWISTFTTGVLRWHNGNLDQFSVKNGLTSNTTKSLFVSSEGAVWIATDAGVDRLRPGAFVPVALGNGSPDEAPASFTVDNQGALWTADRSGILYRYAGGVITGKPGPITTEQRRITGAPVDNLEILSRSSRGGLWLGPSSGEGLLYYQDWGVKKRFDRRDGLPRERPWSAIEGPDGTLWVKHFFKGFGQVHNGRYRALHTPGEPGPENMAVDSAGRLWTIAQSLKAVVMFSGDSISRRIPLPGPNISPMRALVVEGGDTLWALGPRSFFRIASGQAVEVPVPEVLGILEDYGKLAIAGGKLWVASEAGVAGISLSELHRAADGGSEPVTPVIYDQLDGLATPRAKGAMRKSLQVGPDGRLWIATPTGFAVTDDSPRVPNRIPPTVHIEEVSVAGARISLSNGGSVPPNPERLTIRFSAPNLGLPERVRVEHRLLGADKSWVESQPPRVATYDQLRPGTYQFQVRAWNEAGVPSLTTAILEFRVTPAWYQSRWFLSLWVLAIALLGATLAYLFSRARHRRATAAAEARYQAVLSERTRLARELHDTLLQGFTGLTLQLDGVRVSLQDQNREQSEALSSILHRADQTLRDAREMVWDIRQSAPEDLAQTLRAEGDALANPGNVTLEYPVTGTPRPLAPAVSTAILRIAREAMVNALNHAQAKRIVVELSFDRGSVTLEVRDDGCGADLEVVETASARGHWGVAGMRERARSVGGVLTLRASPGEGTRVGVRISA